MDIQIMQQMIPQYITALKVTIGLGASGIFLSFVLGFLMALINYFQVPVLNKINQIYIELSRNTPLLIQIFFLYYGLPKLGIPLGKNMAGVIGLTFLGTSYMAEAFRGGFDSIPKVQLEIGQSLGFSRRQLAKEVILPQGLSLSIPSLGANAIFLMKETSVFSAISIMDLTNVTKDLIGMYYMTREFLLMLVVSYALIILPMIGIIYLLERRQKYVRL